MLSQKPNLRWGIIGCGDVTEKKSGPAYQQTEGFTLEGVMRRNLPKAQDYAARHGVPRVFQTAEELIASPHIDAVYIATPPDSHAAYALAVAAAGKPCCIEKPMTPSYAESVCVLDAFEKAQQPVFVAYYRRSLPRFLKVKEWIDSGRIGTPRQVNWTLTKNTTELDTSARPNWRTEASVAPGGYFDDLASHGLDLFGYLFGKISNARGLAANQQGLYSAKDSISACWIHESGITGSGCWNFGCQKEDDCVEVFGSRGLITFSVFQEKPVGLQSAHGDESLFIPHPAAIQLPFVEALRDHLAGKACHPSLGESGAHCSWVLDQILSK